MQVRYRFRIYPPPGQKQMLARTFGCTRVVYNDCLQLRNAYHAAGKTISGTEGRRQVVTKGSANRARSRHQVAVLHRKVRETRLDHAHKTALRLARDNQAVYAENLCVSGRFEPTSQMCSACGVKDGPKPLRVRTWTCAAGGTTHDRDVNAAKNVLALGRRESLNACGGNVRPGLVPADPGETGTHRSAA